MAHWFPKMTVRIAALFCTATVSTVRGGDAEFGSTIADFRGVVTGGVAEVVWTTESQLRTAAFRVSRREGTDIVPLVEGWLPVDVRLNGGGQTFRVREPARRAGQSGTYLLEETLVDGKVQRVGEWTVRFEQSVSSASAKTAAPLAAPAQQPTQEPLSAPAAKVPVTTSDVFAVSYAAIASVLGLSELDVADLAALRQLRMRCGDRMVAYLPDPPRNRLLFYGWPATNRYTRTNFFWIENAAGEHMSTLPTAPTPVSDDQTFDSVRDLELDRYVQVDVDILRDDLFYWDAIVSKAPGDASAEKVYSVPLDGYAGGAVTMRVRFFGYADNKSLNPDHRVELRFNGVLRATLDIEGTAEAEAVFSVPESDVLPMGNELRVRGVLFPGQSFSYPLLDGYSVAYRRYYAPAADLTRAGRDGNSRLGAGRFSDAVVLDITDPYRPVAVADPVAGIPAGHSWAAEPDSVWAFRERAAIPTLMPVGGGRDSGLRAATNRVDYLVIAPREFESAAQDLANYRVGQGLRVRLAFVEDVYDQFAGGLKTPDAIREFLRYAQQHWAEPPWMVVLTARGHHDYLNGVVTEPNRIPALLTLVSGGGGLKPADGLFADTRNDDGVPDIAVGRIPARSLTALQNYINKLKAYEALGPQPYHARAVFIADLDDPEAGFFSLTNEAMAARAAARYSCELHTLNTEAVSEVRSAALGAFTGGAGLIHYTGHGTHNLVAHSTRILLQNADFASMSSPQMPVVLALTCLIGRFDHMTAVYLGEQMVLSAEGGAVAVYAPTSISWNYFAEQLGVQIHRVHAEEGVGTLGLALVRARQTLGGGSYSDALRTYTLLGDPAIKLGGGGGATTPAAAARTFAAWRWERFTPAQLTDPAVSGPDATAPGKTWTNFDDYVYGGETPGLRIFEVDDDTGRGQIEWTQRILPADLEYRLWITSDLRAPWQLAPPDTVITRTPQPDGATEHVRAAIRFEGAHLFVKLEVIPP